MEIQQTEIKNRQDCLSSVTGTAAIWRVNAQVKIWFMGSLNRMWACILSCFRISTGSWFRTNLCFFPPKEIYTTQKYINEPSQAAGKKLCQHSKALQRGFEIFALRPVSPISNWSNLFYFLSA